MSRFAASPDRVGMNSGAAPLTKGQGLTPVSQGLTPRATGLKTGHYNRKRQMPGLSPQETRGGRTKRGKARRYTGKAKSRSLHCAASARSAKASGMHKSHVRERRKKTGRSGRDDRGGVGNSGGHDLREPRGWHEHQGNYGAVRCDPGIG
jgi:hypothetical protein